MPDPAQINRSLGSIRTELEYLRDSGVLSPPQFSSIMAQLPVRATPIELMLHLLDQVHFNYNKARLMTLTSRDKTASRQPMLTHATARVPSNSTLVWSLSRRRTQRTLLIRLTPT